MNFQVDNLTFRYGRRKPTVLEDVSLTFDSGGVVGLLGPNGAGKSTLLYLMSGALLPTKGVVTYNGISTSRRDPNVLSSIYLVAEEAELPRMSLAQYVKYYSRFYPNFDYEVMQMSLKEFEMFEPKRLDSISMGQRKKVLLSFAFACNTPVVLLDEPTNGLDIPGKAAFRRLVARLASDERLFLISTHQVRDLETILDKVLIMDNNRFLLDTSIANLQTAFTFGRGSATAPENVIYSMPSVMGTDYIAENKDDSQTEVNLEMLFEATLKHPEQINSILSASIED